MRTPQIPKEQASMTVGSLRLLLQGLDDRTPIAVEWEQGHVPGDFAPGVGVFGFRKELTGLDGSYIAVRVGLVWPEEEGDDE